MRSLCKEEGMKCQGELNGKGETEAGLFFCSPGTFHLEVHVCLSLPMLAECIVFLYHLSNISSAHLFVLKVSSALSQVVGGSGVDIHGSV